MRKLKVSTHRNFRHRVCLVLLIMLITGCGTANEMQDLEQFLEETRNSQRGRVEPLPQFKPFETFQYAAAQIRDPFARWQDEAAEDKRMTNNATGPKPDFDRRKELLEKFPLDALKMVGTLAKDGENWAIIRAPDSMIYRVKEGNYLGQNYGKITLLADEKIAVMELVPDGVGGWLEREAALLLVDE